MQDIQSLIDQKLNTAYGAASQPDYSFVNREIRKQPYKRVIDEIKTRFETNDITEINYDVSFNFLIKSDVEYLLQLSMAGKFFILFRFDDDRNLINTENDSANETTAFILQKLKGSDFIRIDESLMNLPTKLNDSDLGRPLTIYQALFTTG